MRIASLLLLCISVALPTTAQTAQSARAALPSIESKTEGLERRDGFVPLYWDEKEGKVWFEISGAGEDFLYVVSLATGLGSNDVGLDRNRLGPQRVVRFERIGRRLFLMEPNLRFRALSSNPDEVRATTDAFAEGTVWAFNIAARTDDRFLVDATDFVVRDAYGIARRLKWSKQGDFKLSAQRSAPFPEVIKAFPENSEIEAQLTFLTDAPGRFVRAVAADSNAVTLRIRHSLIKLPDAGYEPRRFDPRSGFNQISFSDYAAPIGDDMVVRYINRHRLEKVDPTAPVSEAVEPIVYYLDRGTPEPVRSALLKGGRWWNEAFAAAGFSNAFRMEMLPEGADPLDVRYNVMNWVHRSTRGWSYGYSVNDPRTGEIIKGHVSLGSLRVRQDYLLIEGILSPYPGEQSEPDDPMLDAALARLSQLSAHEIGHTIGLSHNFAASVNDRASVMDYPAPLIQMNEAGRINLDNVYDQGIGEWDKVAIRYGYSIAPDSLDEATFIKSILDDAFASGHIYITDSDARGSGAAHPLANLWDNGVNPADALETAIELRRRSLERFGIFAVRQGRPLATMHEVLVPLYLHHRYQTQAAAKLLGGFTYTYALRGEAGDLPRSIDPRLQRQSLDALLETLDPEFLALPVRLRRGIPPRPPGYAAGRELFRGYTQPIFDPYAPAEAAASLTVTELLNPQRLARLMVQADLDASLPGMSDVVADVSNRLIGTKVLEDAYLSEIQRITQQVWIDGLISVADQPAAAPGVRSRLTHHLRGIREWLGANPGEDYETTAHRGAVFDQIDRFLLRLYVPGPERTASAPPPGDPIGSGQHSSREQFRLQERRQWLDAWANHACGLY